MNSHRTRLPVGAIPASALLSAESNAVEHLFKHGKERLVGVGLARVGPGEKRGIADRDYGEPENEIRLKSVAAFFLVIGGIGVTEDAVEEPLVSPGYDGQPAVYLYIAALEVNVLNCRPVHAHSVRQHRPEPSQLAGSEGSGRSE
jgi:hypothetical protein